jgi:hypothetical protein
MDMTALPIKPDPTAGLGAWTYSPTLPADTPQAAPPALVEKFQGMMSRLQSAQGSTESNTPAVPQAAVAKVDSHLQHYTDAINRVMSVKSGEMSLADMHLMQMQTAVQMGMLSMNQAACLQVLGSAKGSISALMKNQ